MLCILQGSALRPSHYLAGLAVKGSAILQSLLAGLSLVGEHIHKDLKVCYWVICCVGHNVHVNGHGMQNLEASVLVGQTARACDVLHPPYVHTSIAAVTFPGCL